MRATIGQRIEDRSSVEPNTGCTLWLGTIASGYPRLKVNGESLSVARLVLGLGDSPLHALHTCDNSWCVGRNHLYAGTHRQNMRDAIRRGRSGLRHVCEQSNHAARENDDG